MDLNDICELNSILQVDDEEKTSLGRKKLTLQAAIKQQEERVRKSPIE